jgi:hypothetical protein
MHAEEEEKRRPSRVDKEGQGEGGKEGGREGRREGERWEGGEKRRRMSTSEKEKDSLGFEISA